MDPKSYVKNAIRTESPTKTVLESGRMTYGLKLGFLYQMRDVISSLKKLDAWKKFIFYGKQNTYVESAPNVQDQNDYITYDDKFLRLAHGSIGLATEAGELLEALESVANGTAKSNSIDMTNIKEELGDCFWYLAILADTAGVDMEEVMERNIAKLKARYPQKFTEDSAINRDLKTERKILEGKQ